MSADVKVWFRFANESYLASIACRQSGLVYAAIFNAHQAVEKGLKTLLVFHGAAVVKTHSIGHLCHLLEDSCPPVRLELDDIDLLDSTFMASRYPLGGILKGVDDLDAMISDRAIEIASNLIKQVREICSLSD